MVVFHCYVSLPEGSYIMVLQFWLGVTTGARTSDLALTSSGASPGGRSWPVMWPEKMSSLGSTPPYVSRNRCYIIYVYICNIHLLIIHVLHVYHMLLYIYIHLSMYLFIHLSTTRKCRSLRFPGHLLGQGLRLSFVKIHQFHLLLWAFIALHQRLDTEKKKSWLVKRESHRP